MIELGLICALAFYVAWNLGANDVANSMGTSVGSGALSLRQAMAIAAVMELLGALLLGARVTSTLATDVLDVSTFAPQPQLLATGMVAVLLAAGVWLQLATWLRMPVSLSHAVVGAIAGFGVVSAGAAVVHWSVVGSISLAWVVTPLLSGAIAAALYSTIERWILTAPRPLAQLYEWLPWLCSGWVTVMGSVIWPQMAIALPLRMASDGTVSPLLPLGLGAIAVGILTFATFRSGSVQAGFARLQIVTAGCVAFAHGSNDVGNAIAPLSVILTIQQTQQVPLHSASLPLWVLGLGAGGIVLGLTMAGGRVIQTVGKDILQLDPSQGFAAEFATAATVLLASRLGLPVSTSHALVGAVVGVGLARRAVTPSHASAIQGKTLRPIALAWGATVPAAALMSGAIALGLIQLRQTLGG